MTDDATRPVRAKAQAELILKLFPLLPGPKKLADAEYQNQAPMTFGEQLKAYLPDLMNTEVAPAVLSARASSAPAFAAAYEFAPGTRIPTSVLHIAADGHVEPANVTASNVQHRYGMVVALSSTAGGRSQVLFPMPSRTMRREDFDVSGRVLSSSVTFVLLFSPDPGEYDVVLILTDAEDVALRFAAFAAEQSSVFTADDLIELIATATADGQASTIRFARVSVIAS